MTTTPVSNKSNSRRLMIIVGDEGLLEQMQSKFPSSSFRTIGLDSEQAKAVTANPKPSKKKPLVCTVCAGPAHGINFGVIACEGCKSFFRRNAFKDRTKLICSQENQCEIKYDTRRVCIPCRLRKCFESGMKRERLSNSQTDSNQVSSTEQESSSIEPRPPPPGDRNLLTPLDLERIETIRMAFANRIEFAASGGLQNETTTVIARNHLEYLNAQTIAAVRFLVFCKQIPEFNQLHVDDKLILSKYNLMTAIPFYYMIAFKSVTNNNVLVMDDDVPLDRSILALVHGDENYSKLQDLFRPIFQIAMSDNKIIHLALVVFILLKGLSTGVGTPEPILQDGMSVHRAHVFYTELLWRYLSTIYGFSEAVRIMSNLVTRFLSWQILEINLRDNVSRNLSERDVNELSPLMKSLFPLW